MRLWIYNVVTVSMGMIVANFAWATGRWALEKIQMLQDESPRNPSPPKWNHKEKDYLSPTHTSSLCRDFDHSIRRPKHGCQVNKNTNTVFCNFENMQINTNKIEMVSKGGEVLSTVMGQDESAELPRYQRGAFLTAVKPKFEVPRKYRRNLHYLEDVLNAFVYPTTRNKHVGLSCERTYKGTTLFVTRYEYVNLFHTIMDWWNTFFVLPRSVYGKNNKNDGDMLQNSEGVAKPDRVVFLDGHAQGMLDSTWKDLFGKFHYIQHMGEGLENGRICFERAIFVPSGYKSEINYDSHLTQCPHKGMTKEFSDFVFEQYNLLQHPKVIPGNIVLVDRQHYVSHPRSDANKTLRRWHDSQLDTLQKRLNRIPGVTVNLVRLETLSFKEQLKLMRKAHILIGMHGAALSHIVFMAESQSHLIEFQPQKLRFYHYMSLWTGISYDMIKIWNHRLDDNAIDDTVEVVKKYMNII